MKKARILLAEDELSLGKIITESLEIKGFEIIYCIDGEDALEKYLDTNPDILVLDVMMPKKDGFTLAKEIRKQNTSIPILFLTAKSQTQDVVKGFHSGGNDYLKKPFSMEELVVRIEALLQRNTTIQQKETDITIGNFTFNPKNQILISTSNSFKLTSREADLLYHLYLKRNEILDRSFILNKLWGNDDFFNARSMDVFISKLRKKLKSDNQIQIINVRGFGYKLVFPS
jgi:DNA-binding response OmpR family regulator